MFASQLGTLVLDEPTVYLDSRNVEMFSDVVTKIQQVAEKLGLQIFISTHEPKIVKNLKNEYIEMFI